MEWNFIDGGSLPETKKDEIEECYTYHVHLYHVGNKRGILLNEFSNGKFKNQPGSVVLWCEMEWPDDPVKIGLIPKRIKP